MRLVSYTDVLGQRDHPLVHALDALAGLQGLALGAVGLPQVLQVGGFGSRGLQRALLLLPQVMLPMPLLCVLQQLGPFLMGQAGRAHGTHCFHPLGAVASMIAECSELLILHGKAFALTLFSTVLLGA